MTPHKLHDLATSIAAAVLECEPGERRALIDASCAEDEELRREVESLLAFEDTGEGFSGEAFVPILREERERQHVGPYRILRHLGRGGMGAVYLAEQEEPVRRQVALKLIQAGMDVQGLLRRFEIERNILANLHHPYVAALFDAGTTEDGWPYFAMEYVDGQPLDVYCDERQLTVRRRLELFRKVCSAVEMAHRNLVVHRDLKAGNILINAEGTPKLLDFGIAKLLHTGSGTSAISAASASFRPMTLACASPEMTRGEPITPASDIYALGVLLYELLAGHRPYSADGRPFLEMLRTIREDKPPPPSAAAFRRGSDTSDEPTPEAVALMRGTVPSRLQRSLTGDLDAIVSRALRKKPQERYGSVAELSADIRRHLEDEPVHAHEPTLGYRAGKLVRRHRWRLMVAASLVLLALSVAVATTVRLRQGSERHRARRTQTLFVEILEDGGAALTVEEVMEKGVDLYGEAFRGEREIQADLLGSLAAVYRSRGQDPSARTLLVEALAIRRDLMGEDDPWVAETRIELARLLTRLGEPGEAERLGRLGLAVLRRHRPDAHAELAGALLVQAGTLLALDRHDEAERLYREAVRMRIDLLGDEHPGVAESLEGLAACLKGMGEPLEAEAALHRARSIRRQR